MSRSASLLSCTAAVLGGALALGASLAFTAPALAQIQAVKPFNPNEGLKATVKPQPLLAPSNANVAKPAPNAAALYGAIAKLPDWSGAWAFDEKPTVLKTTDVVPLTPKYQAKLAALRKDAAAGKFPVNKACAPLGMPLMMQQVGPSLEFIHSPGKVMIYGGDNELRIIFTDGRKHPDDPNPYFNGTSLGRWDKDTLVVSTDYITPEAQTLPGIESTGNLKIVERIHLTGPDKLQDDLMLTNAGMFTKAYSYSTTYTRHRDWDVVENLCLSHGTTR